MKKHLFYTFLIIFALTFTVTILGIVKAVSIDEFYLKGLFSALLIELVGSVIALYKRADFFSPDVNHSSEYSSSTDQRLAALHKYAAQPEILKIIDANGRKYYGGHAGNAYWKEVAGYICKDMSLTNLRYSNLGVCRTFPTK